MSSAADNTDRDISCIAILLQAHKIWKNCPPFFIFKNSEMVLRICWYLITIPKILNFLPNGHLYQIYWNLYQKYWIFYQKLLKFLPNFFVLPKIFKKIPNLISKKYQIYWKFYQLFIIFFTNNIYFFTKKHWFFLPNPKIVLLASE